ncbi:hypothetical protein BGZ52_003739 [Haplosporangium bisporale]|nr:hypothetical protein BGZ52_003739 [Haplosporangium bisporale]
MVKYAVHALEPNQNQAFLEFSGLWDRDLIFGGLFRVALTWLLCSSAPERIQSIDIPLSDIDRYVSVVDRFHSLSSVNFITDFTADIQQHPTNTPSQQLTAKAFKTMAHFVEEMVRLFRTQLRTVTLVKHLDHECLPEIPQRFFQMLPPLDQPQQLNSTNWGQLIILLELTCLDRVKKISTPER